MKATRGWVVVAAGALLFGVASAAENFTRYAALRSTFAADLGSFHNQAFNQAQGRDISYLFMASWFKPGDFDGPSVYRSCHFSPLRTLVIPWIYRLHPRIETLMLLQGLAIGIGALGLYGLALERARSPGLGLLLAVSYLLHPAVLNLAANDFREIALGLGPALIALWLHATGRTAAFVAAALVALSARSEYALLVAAVPLLARRLVPAPSRVPVWLPPALAASWGVLAHGYYQHFYGVTWPVLGYAGQRPLVEVGAELVRRMPALFALMQAPAMVGLLTPEAWALALPFAALAKRVHATEFPPHHLQHLAPALAAVFWAFAVTLVRHWDGPWLAARRGRAVAALCGATLVSFAVFAHAAASAYPRDLGRFDRLGEAIDGLPADATVVAHGSLAARLSRHTRVIDYTRLPFGAPPSAEEAATTLPVLVACADLVAIMEDPALESLVRESGIFEAPRTFRRYRLFLRREDAPRVADADARLQRALLWDRLSSEQRRGATLARW
ncbi:MAG TPA: DUF2079 domain-containing protein [Vicinamibacteria bacterium]|nr:DUF2079 domain-containing protein [Vicinamibacteria bacterium]